jgi:hypothetical protein
MKSILRGAQGGQGECGAGSSVKVSRTHIKTRRWSAARRFHGWLATWLQDRRRARQKLPAPVLRPLYPSLLVWDWNLTNPYKWNVWMSLDSGASYFLVEDYWAYGAARQFAPDGGSELYFIVGVDEVGREITHRSNIVRPDDALPIPPANGLRLWLDARPMLLEEGDPVEFWEDRSGNENHAVADVGFVPVFDATTFGGCVHFDGSTYLVCGSPLMPQPFTVFIVGKFSTAVNEDLEPRLSVFCGGFTTAFYTSEWVNGDLSLYTVGTDSRTVNEAMPYDTPVTVGVVANGMGVSGRLFANGAPATLAPGWAANAGTGFNDAFYVGTWSGGMCPIVGHIAELVVYDRALSDAEMGALHAMLGAKWGLI